MKNLLNRNMSRITHALGYFFCFLFLPLIDCPAQSNNVGISTTEATYKQALELRFNDPDSSLVLFDRSYNEYMQLKDTLNATNSLLEKSYVFENNANYASSYDALWLALILNDARDDDNLKSIIYNRLGRIYSYNKREKQSFKYLQRSLKLQKKRIEKLNLKESDLVPFYYSLAKTNRELKRYVLARKYLDSCYMYYSKDMKVLPLSYSECRNKAYLDFEGAILLSQNNDNVGAIKIMDDIFPWFEQKEPSYLVLFYKYLGDMYLNTSNLDKAEDFYRKSLTVSEENKSHVDFTPLVYEKLAELYLKRDDFKNAFESINSAKLLDARFFDGRSSINQSLLEIKDDYRLEKERQEKQIQEQYLKQLEQEAEIKNLQRIILFVSIIFLLIIGYFYIKHIRSKHLIEKELIRKNKELEITKAKELLELKNKELAASALQLIEKEEFLKDLKAKIRVGDSTIKKSELNKILRSVSVNNNSTWDEFKLRFIEVNKEFYDKIFEKYPNLSQGDQKICALIKLNMSSKEMSRLLGISVESVHTSRHRIRKKMKLPRTINLEDYINSL